MSCHKITSPDGSVAGFICLSNIFKFEGYYFEWHSYPGPTPVRKRDFEPRTTIPAGFWEMIDRWQKLSEQEQEQYRIAG